MYEKIKKDIAQEYYMKNYPNDGQRFVTRLRRRHVLPMEPGTSRSTRFILMTSRQRYTLSKESFIEEIR